MISLHLIEQVIASSIYMTTPILLAGIGGLVNRQAGIVNIALEAKMLVGAFVSIVVSSATGGHKSTDQHFCLKRNIDDPGLSVHQSAYARKQNWGGHINR
jgi:hypothetical protein